MDSERPRLATAARGLSDHRGVGPAPTPSDPLFGASGRRGRPGPDDIISEREGVLYDSDFADAAIRGPCRGIVGRSRLVIRRDEPGSGRDTTVSLASSAVPL